MFVQNVRAQLQMFTLFHPLRKRMVLSYNRRDEMPVDVALCVVEVLFTFSASPPPILQDFGSDDDRKNNQR